MKTFCSKDFFVLMNVFHFIHHNILVLTHYIKIFIITSILPLEMHCILIIKVITKTIIYYHV